MRRTTTNMIYHKLTDIYVTNVIELQSETLTFARKL